MVGRLTQKEIEHRLEAQHTGRIGCCVEGKIYILPIQYVYHEGYIYAHAKEGFNLHLLRMNPSVCFETDWVSSEEDWQSILLWGNFEELRYPVRGAQGRKLLNERLQPAKERAGNSTIQAAPLAAPQQAARDRKPIDFRIKITESSGHFEKPDQTAQAWDS